MEKYQTKPIGNANFVGGWGLGCGGTKPIGGAPSSFGSFGIPGMTVDETNPICRRGRGYKRTREVVTRLFPSEV